MPEKAQVVYLLRLSPKKQQDTCGVQGAVTMGSGEQGGQACKHQPLSNYSQGGGNCESLRPAGFSPSAFRRLAVGAESLHLEVLLAPTLG